MKLPIVLLSTLVPALAWSPTDSYAPGNVSCPAYVHQSDTGLVRAADSLSDDESTWIDKRHEITDKNLISWLEHANITDFKPADFINNANRSINIAVAFSGGGYRAMLNGAGQLSALDNRTEGAYEHGLGGLIESTTYLAGLSGGNWLVGTLAWNNWTSVQSIVDGNGIWDLRHSIISPGGFNVFKDLGYWDDIDDDLDAKEDAGYDLSLTDVWGRTLSHQFFPNYTDAGAALTFSTLRDASVFKSHQMPFPVVVADGRTPGSYVISGNSTIFEFNPFEMGSWDPSLYSFTDVKYLGTPTKNGVPTDDCVGGFENTGFIMGTSSTLFNQFILQLNTSSLSGALYDIVEHFLKDLSDDDNDIASYTPNPFYGTKWAGVESIVKNETLYLVDGGEDDQNIPLYPLLQSQRDVDVIIAFDNSADTDQYWPNGTSLVYSYERQFSTQGNGTAFPYVPDMETFLALNLTAKPAFFGCNGSNLTSLLDEVGAETVPPLVVYMANRPFSYQSNTSTFKLSYTDEERNSIIQNGFEVASRLNMTLDDEWRACLGCAIVQREFERQGKSIGEQCTKCFSEYCWDGSYDDDSVIGVNYTTDGLTNGDQSTEGSSGTAKSGASFVNPGWALVTTVLAVVMAVTL
ncbi:unnamed protein product [Kuraishia capsulata CBS 1993]|uniref:Lysophospholipase n=1 Tax=Kuraishia capsulata CBS 1993 TaxID=1382522 RepID=W6MUW9_9ASCO|nr:uncharacterized protein KUCA_T00005595001 [Kuraishia capsulata CBS 1993]CDK29602.1 unnamed protein product [Kuraishia capsulata CBS 1993]